MTTPTTLENLSEAKNGSYYTIRGTGGDLDEWVNGYEKLMSDAGIGKPTAWFTTTGLAVNEYAQPARWQDAFAPDLTLLMFPLDGLVTGKLAMFRLQMGDVWFDDMIDNMSPTEAEEEDGR